jgi:hypothetical protein
MASATPDDTLERLEAEIKESQFGAWDVEEFLARRHQAKINALTAPETTSWARRWEVVKQLFWGLMALVGYLATGTMIFFWVLTGNPLPQPRYPEPRLYELPDGQLTLIPPPKAPALPRDERPDR